MQVSFDRSLQEFDKSDREIILSRVLEYIDDKSQSTFRLVAKEWAETGTPHLVKCQKKIIRYILDNQYLYVDSTNVKEKEQKEKRYFVIFRRSYSWKVFSKKLLSLSSTHHEWAKTWLKNISNLYKLQNQFLEADEEVLNEFSKCESICQHEELHMSKENKEREQQIEQKRQILTLIESIKIEAETQRQKIVSEPQQKLLSSFLKHWDELTVFLDWPEVSMDSQELFVRVSECETLARHYISQNAANQSLKAFFIVNAENWSQKTIFVEQGRPIEMYYPNKVSSNGKFGRESPSPRPTSANQIKALANYQLSMELNTDKGRLSPQSLGITSEVQTIAYLMLQTITHINNELKIKDHSQDLKSGLKSPTVALKNTVRKIFESFKSVNSRHES